MSHLKNPLKQGKFESMLLIMPSSKNLKGNYFIKHLKEIPETKRDLSK